MNGGCGTPSSCPVRVHARARRPRCATRARTADRRPARACRRLPATCGRRAALTRLDLAVAWPSPAASSLRRRGARRAPAGCSPAGGSLAEADACADARRSTARVDRLSTVAGGARRAPRAASRSRSRCSTAATRVAVLCGRERVARDLRREHARSGSGRSRRRHRADRAGHRRRASSSTSPTSLGDALLVYHLRAVRAHPPRPSGRRTVRDRLRPRALGAVDHAHGSTGSSTTRPAAGRSATLPSIRDAARSPSRRRVTVPATRAQVLRLRSR